MRMRERHRHTIFLNRTIATGAYANSSAAASYDNAALGEAIGAASR